MEKAEIIKKLTGIFETTFDQIGIVITEDLTAEQVQRWDSLTHLSMISEVESSFGIRFKLKELVSMKNVGDLIVLIENKVNI